MAWMIIPPPTYRPVWPSMRNTSPGSMTLRSMWSATCVDMKTGSASMA